MQTVAGAYIHALTADLVVKAGRHDFDAAAHGPLEIECHVAAWPSELPLRNLDRQMDEATAPAPARRTLNAF